MVKDRNRPAPLKPGDTVCSYLRPDERYIVVDLNPPARMVLCRATSGDEFWAARSVLTIIEAKGGSK